MSGNPMKKTPSRTCGLLVLDQTAKLIILMEETL